MTNYNDPYFYDYKQEEDYWSSVAFEEDENWQYDREQQQEEERVAENNFIYEYTKQQEEELAEKRNSSSSWTDDPYDDYSNNGYRSSYRSYSYDSDNESSDNDGYYSPAKRNGSFSHSDYANDYSSAYSSRRNSCGSSCNAHADEQKQSLKKNTVEQKHVSKKKAVKTNSLWFVFRLGYYFLGMLTGMDVLLPTDFARSYPWPGFHLGNPIFIMLLCFALALPISVVRLCKLIKGLMNDRKYKTNPYVSAFVFISIGLHIWAVTVPGAVYTLSSKMWIFECILFWLALKSL